MIKVGQVSVRCKETSLDLPGKLVILADVVPGGLYFVLNGLSSHTGSLTICVWVDMVFKSCLSVYFTFYVARFCSFVTG